jgi:hypothetical protein
MADYNIQIFGLKEFQDAIQKNPQVVATQVSRFLVRAVALYRSQIQNNPWRIGMSGGGSPVRTGNLRDTHIDQVGAFQASIRPTAPYAEAVHKGRPWLDYAMTTEEQQVNNLESEMGDEIIRALAS